MKIGTTELIIILVVVIIIFGPTQIPKLTKMFGKSVKNYMPYSLGNIFTSMDVDSFAYHNYIGSYYGRNKTHVNMGYKCRFMEDMKFTSKWPTSDLEMFKQTVDDYIGLDRFNVYYMTFSGHLPYNSFSANSIANKNKAVTNGLNLPTNAKVYIACNQELENDIAMLSTSEGIEQRAREQFGWVRGDEHSVRITNVDATSDTHQNAGNGPIAQVPTGSVEAPSEWYTPFLNVLFGVG